MATIFKNIFLLKSLQDIYSKESLIFDNRDVQCKFKMTMNISKIQKARDISNTDVFFKRRLESSS